MDGNDKAYPIGTDRFVCEWGLTKRELIAAMAMQGLLADPNVRLKPDAMSKWAVDQADALIERLSADPVAEGINILPMCSGELDEGLTDGN
jgi:hypothetical protein